MTNLPITSNNPQSPASVTPGNSPLGRNDSSAAAGNASSASQTNSAANDQTAESFSVLLARQIGGDGETALNSKKISIAFDGKTAAGDADIAAKDAQDQTTTSASISGDQAGTLAAMMLQIPVQQTAMPAKGTPVVDTLHPSGAPAADRGLPLTRGEVLQSIEDRLTQTSGKSAGKDGALPAAGSKQLSESSLPVPLAPEAIKHMEILASPTSQHQGGQTNTKADIPGAATAGIPNIMTNNTPANIAQTITTPIGSSGWADEFSQKIIWMSNQQNMSAELHLNPPDLGPLNVMLKISDNQLTAMFTSPHSAVRDAIENALPKLREILADNSIMLGNATVSDQPPRDRSGEGFMNQGSGTASQREASFDATKSNEMPPGTAQITPARRHNGMLDTFA